jgi:hypothetical protein
VRLDALTRAEVRVQAPAVRPPVLELGPTTPLACRFVARKPTGTTAKFDCILPDGQVIKVKYGRNPEIHAETAAATLLTMLGYPADTVEIVRRLRCYGCPQFPFFTMQVLTLMHLVRLADAHAGEDRYTDFEWVAVERQFPAPSIEAGDQKGWNWWELKYSRAPRADLDALRLLAVFLAHWDNKADNQRLVCLDDPAPGPGERCGHPLAMIQDLGATFGPFKANLAGWHDAPIWSDRNRCIVSMNALPYGGATFPDAQITEAGRQQLASALTSLSNAQVRNIFEVARFGAYYSSTDDSRDVDAWTAAFDYRVRQISGLTCSQ